MVVEALCHEPGGQWRLLTGGLLDLGPLVLEPDLDLGLVEPQPLRQVLSPLLREVAVLLEFSPQVVQLFRGERCPGPLLFVGGLGLLCAPGPRACREGRTGQSGVAVGTKTVSTVVL